MNWPMLTTKWNLKTEPSCKKPTGRDKRNQEDPPNERCPLFTDSFLFVMSRVTKMDELRDICYQPSHLWKGQSAIRKHRPLPKSVNRPHYEITIPKQMHQFDLLYMPSNTLYGNKYKYILSGIDVASRYKVTRPLRTKQAADIAAMIADIYKIGPLTYPVIFQCDNGSEFKGEVIKLLQKHEVAIRRVMTKYKHTHMAFVEALNKVLTGRLFKVQDVQELNNCE